jgi:uncharacterized membrane protein (DUF106 family)
MHSENCCKVRVLFQIAGYILASIIAPLLHSFTIDLVYMQPGYKKKEKELKAKEKELQKKEAVSSYTKILCNSHKIIPTVPLQ